MNVLTFCVLVLASLFAYISSVSGSVFSRNEIRAQKMLLDNITKFYQRTLPVRILEVVPTHNDEELEQIKDELWNFSPYLLFEEDWFNRAVHEIAFNVFPRGQVLDNPTTPDYTSLMALKLLIEDPHKSGHFIHQAVLCFLFELVFGPDAHVPENEKYHWRFFFGDKIQSYELPMTRDFYYKYLTEGTEITDADSWINLFEFLSRNPSVEEHRIYNLLNFYNKRPLYANRYCPVQIILYEMRVSSSLNEAIYDPVIIFNYLDQVLAVGPNAPVSLFKRIPNNSVDKAILWAQTKSRRFKKSFWAFPILHELFGWPDSDAGLTYILTRNYLNHFDIEEFKAIVGDCSDDRLKTFIEALTACNLKDILKFDIFIKIYSVYSNRRF